MVTLGSIPNSNLHGEKHDHSARNFVVRSSARLDGLLQKYQPVLQHSSGLRPPPPLPSNRPLCACIPGD